MFLHGGWLHLLGNMLFLFVFGNNVEDRLGRLRFLAFYLACGYAATYVFSLFFAGSSSPLVGASGAIERPQIGRGAERAAMLVGDAHFRQAGGEARLRHSRSPRLRTEADVDQPLHAGRLQLGDQRLGHQQLVSDRPDGRHAMTLAAPGE